MAYLILWYYPGIRREELRKTTKTSIRIVSRWSRYLNPNMKQECYPLYHDVRLEKIVIVKLCRKVWEVDKGREVGEAHNIRQVFM
jgi:hypothetical protein